MFSNGGFHSQFGNNDVKTEKKFQPIVDNKHSHTNQVNKTHQSPSAKASFIKRFNPFSKSKSQTISCNSDCARHESPDDKEFASVKVLKQFWNEQIKVAKSTEHLNRTQKSATIKYRSQSNDSLNDPPIGRAEKSQTLDGHHRLPLDEFNKFKDADFIRNKKNRLKSLTTDAKEPPKAQPKFSRPESFTLNDSHFPQVSATGGKIHWAKREDILARKQPEVVASMSVKSKSENAAQKPPTDSVKSMSSSVASVASLNSSASSNTNSASRKFSFKTNVNKKATTSSSGNKVAQIAQRFNQMIQQDASLLDEVKKRGTVVVARSGGCVFKIKEEKVDGKASLSHKKSNDYASDDAASLPSIGKNSTRKKSSLKKRPSIRILVESPRKDGGNVLSKKQLYETNIVGKDTIVLKPKVPDKSERVLAKTKELKNKKLIEMKKTEPSAVVEPILECAEPAAAAKKNNFQKIYDRISFRPTFLYGKKAAKLETTVEAKSPSPTVCEEVDDELEFRPIDLNLNVYFNSENLSASPKDLCVEDGNASSQGPCDDVTATDECKPDQSAADMKPNTSFLFRAQSGGKLESASDVFFRDMLGEPSTVDEEKCNDDQENSYEVISRLTMGECADIDQPNGTQNEGEENIYQSLCEVKGDDTASVRSYESFENYDEIAQNILDNKISFPELLAGEDDYILPQKAPEPPPPRKNTIPKISSPILTSTTSDLVPHDDLHVPKLKPNYELQKSNSCASTTYEKIKYDQLPTLGQHQQSAKLPLPPRNDDHGENIYDTIKSGGDNRSLIIAYNGIPDKNDKSSPDAGDSFANCGDNDNPYKNSKNDTMSIISNCYESISLKQNYSTINQILRHAISTTTLTSEHRINSIYGTMIGQSLTPPSDRSASDNSDEWIDLSDEENDVENVTDNRFIV